MELRPYQIGDLAFYMAREKCINLSDPGTGKTPSVCVDLYRRWVEDGVRSIWSMPLSLLKKNLKELLLFSNFKPEDVVIVNASSPKKRRANMESDAKVFLMGFQCFADHWETMLELHPDIDHHAIDEYHLGFGGPNSNRTRQLIEFQKRVRGFLPMTGTFINGRLSTAYSAIKVIEPHLYDSPEHFMAVHAFTDSFGRVQAWMNPDPIKRFLARHGIRHTFEDIYGKEAKTIIPEVCEMDPAQRAAYTEFEDTAVLELEESWLEGTLPGVNFIRCRQLMEHPQTFGAPLDNIKLTGKEQRLLIHLEHAKETGEPIIIFAALQPSIDRIVAIAEKMGFRVGKIDGTVSLTKRTQIDEAFQRGDLDVVVASPATAGVGFNWGHVNVMVFMSVDCMDSSFVQGYRRAIRGVRGQPLLIYVMEYENSLDQRLFDIIRKKSKLAQDVDDDREVVKLGIKRTPPKFEPFVPTMSRMVQK